MKILNKTRNIKKGKQSIIAIYLSFVGFSILNTIHSNVTITGTISFKEIIKGAAKSYHPDGQSERSHSPLHA